MLYSPLLGSALLSVLYCTLLYCPLFFSLSPACSTVVSELLCCFAQLYSTLLYSPLCSVLLYSSALCSTLCSTLCSVLPCLQYSTLPCVLLVSVLLCSTVLCSAQPFYVMLRRLRSSPFCLALLSLFSCTVLLRSAVLCFAS